MNYILMSFFQCIWRVSGVAPWGLSQAPSSLELVPSPYRVESWALVLHLHAIRVRTTL